MITELVAAYQAGESTVALEKRFPARRTSISKVLASQGVPTRWHRLAPEAVDKACHLYVEKQLPLAEIAPLVGASRSAVRRALVERGVAMRPRGGSKPGH